LSFIGVGDGGQREGARAPLPEIGEKMSGNFYVKFGHFSGKTHVKLRNFVDFRANIIKIRVF